MLITSSTASRRSVGRGETTLGDRRHADDTHMLSNLAKMYSTRGTTADMNRICHQTQAPAPSGFFTALHFYLQRKLIIPHSPLFRRGPGTVPSQGHSRNYLSSQLLRLLQLSTLFAASSKIFQPYPCILSRSCYNPNTVIISISIPTHAYTLFCIMLLSF